MYEYLKGIITKITAKYIVLETNGIGYILHVANPYAYSGQVNQEAQIYVHQVVREDAHLLYGFRSEEEKKLFLSLISVSGIGPVSALAIIAADDNAGLVQAIETKNWKKLWKPCWHWATRRPNSRKSRNSSKERQIQLRTISSRPLRCWSNRSRA